MADLLLNALHRKLAVLEGAGLSDQAKRVKARITKLEKASASPPAEPPAEKSAAKTKTVKKGS